METRIKTTDYDITPEVSAYLEEKLESISKLLTEDASAAHCYVEVGRAAGHPHQGNIWRAEITITQKGERLHADASAESVNAAIDAVKDEILQLLRKSKGKRFTRIKKIGGQLKRLMR